MAARQLAGNLGPLHRLGTRCEKADQERDLPALSPVGRDAEAAGGNLGRRRWRQVPDPAFSGIGKDQLHRLVVEHYRALVQPLLAGKAKAMVVVGSRLEAVRWQLAMEAYIKSKGYALGALVAFSGEVNDPQSSPEPLAETNKLLNPGLKGGDIRETFKRADYHVLIVANKFQTGFDQAAAVFPGKVGS